ncbi:MAG: DNA repair protein RadC [Betaproteobacteria bacterium]
MTAHARYRSRAGAERPRERLVAHGVASLTDAELVAVVLGTGTAGSSSLDVAHALLERCEGLRGISRAEPAALAAMRGLGAGKAARLAAGIEIARRALAADIARGDALSSPDAVRDYLKLVLGPETVEVFVGLFLDSQHRLIASEELARGTLAQTSVYPREVVKTALARNAAAVIFAHNHPSGVAEPSRADELLTQSLKNALALVDVRTLDHFVVAGARVTSFAERGLL